MDARPDGELVRRYLDGQAAAFDALLARYGGPIYSYLLRLCGRPDEAEDLFQETMMRAIRGLSEGYREEGRFRPWLYRIAQRTAVDHLRKRRPLVSLDAPADTGADTVSLHEALADEGPSPFRNAAEREDWERLVRAAGKLSAEQQQVFWMRVLGELPFDEIAQALDCPLNTALGRMHDAVRKLRAALEESDDDLPWRTPCHEPTG